MALHVDPLFGVRRPWSVAAGRFGQPAGRELPKQVFNFSEKECSLGTNLLKTITETRSSWPVMSPAMASKLLLAAKGEWDTIANAWRSLVLIPGSIVGNKCENKRSLF